MFVRKFTSCLGFVLAAFTFVEIATSTTNVTEEIAAETLQDLCATENGSDACTAFISNHFSIATDIKESVEDVVRNLTGQLMKNTEEMQALGELLKRDPTDEVLRFEALEICRADIDNRKSEVTHLQGKVVEVQQVREVKTISLNDLRLEVAALKEKKVSLAQRIQCLKRETGEQDIRIANIQIMTYMPMDCADLQYKGQHASGVYNIYPYEGGEPKEVQCDFDSNGGAWTVFFSRMEQEVPVKFDAPWEDFKRGFGNASREYWIGNDVLHVLTSNGPTSLRIDATNYEGESRFAEWHSFQVASEEDKYRLTLDEYQDDSTLGDSLYKNNGCFFSTVDRDNDNMKRLNCAAKTFFIAGGAWWYNKCGDSRLTAPLKNVDSMKSASWLRWTPGTRKLVSFSEVSLKFRRHNFGGLGRTILAL